MAILSTLAGLGAAGAAFGVNNLMAEYHANNAFKRQKELMLQQNAMNNANAKNSYSNMVQGLKMAGLNPAMASGASPSTPSVGLGSAPKAENVEMSPSDILAISQAKNLDADTNLKNEQAGNTKEDTNLKMAQTLLVGADTNKVKEEYQQIKFFNDEFAAENDSISNLGQAMAEKWKTSEWYSKLGPDSKRTVDAIADGSVPLSIGGLRALDKLIQTQHNLSDADRAVIDNAFANVITEGMWNDPEVKKALQKMPLTQQNEARARINNYWADVGLKKIDKKWQQDNYESFKVNNVDYRYKEYWKNPNLENFVKWITASSNEKLNKAYDATTHMIPAAAGGYMAGKAAKGAGSSPSSEKSSKTFQKNGLRGFVEHQMDGVQNFHR